MRALTTLLFVTGFACSTNAFASESVTIEGKILDSKHCAPLKMVKGMVSGTNRRIVVCAGDVNTASFTNGANKSALTDGKTYFIVGKLFERTLSVSEIAAMNE